MGPSRRAARILICFALSYSGLLAADLKDLEKTLFERLSSRASETVDVTLDQTALRMAAGFLSSSGDDDATKIRKLISGLKNVTVHSFEFKKKGEYTAADVDAIHGAIKLSGWTRIVNVRSKADGNNAEVYILPGKDKPEGLFIVATEPLQMTVVYIEGRVDLNDLAALEGLGIPKIGRDGKIEKSDKNKDEP